MCGISGIVSCKERVDTLATEIRKITDLVRHRGPDDEGYFISEKFAFGHRRLAILDLSKAGHQPMHYLNRYVLVYNGEIYNYLELKKQLTKEGYVFQSNTDTEMIMAAYDKWGDNCVTHFNGMWSFALYDKQRNVIFCSRDRFGVKPFYFTEIRGKFVFGSEIKQLLEYYPNPQVNQAILMDYLIIGYEDHTEETFFKNIFKLKHSHNLVYDLNTGQYVQSRYYSLQPQRNTLSNTSRDTIEQEYLTVLKQAVSIRLRSDVKVGTCLSGGLDSSAVASIASSFYSGDKGRRFTAIHARTGEVDTDESNYARMVSTHSRLDLHVIEPSIKEFVSQIDEVVYTQEEPFGSPSVFMQYFVMKKARELGCLVMLDGQGGDETLLGYERYYPAYIVSLNLIDRLKALFLSSRNSRLSLKQVIFYYFYFTHYRLRLFKLEYDSRFIRPEFRSKMNKKMLRENAGNYLSIDKLQNQEILTTQMPHLLRYEDKNAMRNSVESRLPFIDYRVVEKAVSLDSEQKIFAGWTKYILRRSLNTILPQEVIWRKNKLGFNAPEDRWLNTIKDEMRETIDKSSIVNAIVDPKKYDFDRLSWKKRWRLYNTAKWQEVYNVVL